MFKMFKKKEIVSNNSDDYSHDVIEVHHEFFTASDKALLQAQEVLKEGTSKIVEKGKRLISLGFNRAKEAKEVSSIESNIETAKEIANNILLYRERYPYHKYITNEDIINICKKYNLVYGEASRYLGFVPEVKLRQIEDFIPHKEDKNSITVADVKSDSVGDWKVPNILTFANADIRQSHNFLHIFPRSHKDTDKYAFQSRDGVDFYGTDDYNLFGYRKLGYLRFSVVKGLMICAPLKDMDTTGISVKNNMLIKDIPDPITVYPVKGGAIILAAWGPEASDPLVINEKMN